MTNPTTTAPRLTAGEKTRIAFLVARMAKRGITDDRQYGGAVNRGLERKVDRILDGARRRADREALRARR